MSLLSGRGYLWISAVETSADLHGQKLIAALNSLGCEYGFVGIGGKNISKEDIHLLYSSEEFSVMGLSEVIGHIPKIIRSYKKIREVFETGNIKGAVLIDAPDFHFKIAKIAGNFSIPVYYYISPQAWAWRRGRVKFLKKHVKKLLCIFPFEEEFFKRYGVDAEYVGHPLMESLDFSKLDSIKRDKDTLLLLPGSRLKEVKNILPIMARGCEIICSHYRGIKIKIVKAPGIDKDIIKNSWTSHLKYEEVSFEDRYEEMARANLGIVASGTASLECGLIKLPSVVVYKVSWPTYFFGKLLVNTDFISMTNIMMQKEVFPELIQTSFTPENVASYILDWLKRPVEVEKKRKELSNLRRKFGDKKASIETAKIILGNSDFSP